MIGTVIASVLSAILLLIVVRINGTEEAGIFSISYATAIILNAIGDFGLRILEVTDIKRKYSFGEYLAARVTVVTFMIIFGCIFSAFSNYKIDKILELMFFVLFKVVDNLSESYQAEFQLADRLDLAGKTLIIRNICSIIVFLIIDIATKNTILSTFSLFAINLIVLIFTDMKWVKKINNDKISFNKEKIVKIIKECLPVCISTLLGLYLTNSVKYAIDATGNNEMQTYFNVIYLPTFTINLISICIMKPLLNTLAEKYESKDNKGLLKTIGKVILFIILVTIMIIAVCVTIGLPILMWMYGLELEQYRMELIILVISGGLYAIATLLFYTLSTMRKQKYTTYVYAVVSIFACFITRYLVLEFQMFGVALGNIIINFVLVILLSVILATQIDKSKK